MFKKHNSTYFFSALILALISCKSVYSQGSISLYSSGDRSIHRISVLNGNYDVFYENHVDTLPSYDLKYDPENWELPVKGQHFFLDGALICVFGGTGKVFSVDTANGIIERIDNTIFGGYNFDAYQFVRNDTIFSFGGYGFWTENNLLTYFSQLRKEWSVYSVGTFPPYNPDFLKSPAYKFAFYDPTVDALFVVRQNFFYKYSFNTGLWEKLGDLAIEEIFPTKGTFGISRMHRMNDSTVMIMGGLSAYYVVPKNNVIYDVTLPNGLNASPSNQNHPLGFHCGYDLENELLIAKFSDKLDQQYVFEYVNRIPRKINSESKLYEQTLFTNQAKFSLTLFLILLVGGVATYWIRMLYIRRRYQYFTEAQWAFIQRLDKGGLQTEELNEFLELGSSSWEVQRRKRSEYIKMINDLCVNQLGCELVLRQRSKEDKRQVLYVMNVEAKNKLARLM